jgi:hypothetical protein
MPEGHVLILTLVKDASPSLAMYFSALSTLSYPGELISLGFLESDSHDDTYELLLRQTAGLAGRYRSIGVWKRDFGFQIPAGQPRWSAAGCTWATFAPRVIWCLSTP